MMKYEVATALPTVPATIPAPAPAATVSVPSPAAPKSSFHLTMAKDHHCYSTAAVFKEKLSSLQKELSRLVKKRQQEERRRIQKERTELKERKEREMIVKRIRRMIENKKSKKSRFFRSIHYWREILDVTRCDSWKAINVQYKRYVVILHPDKNSYQNNDDLFIEVTQARKELHSLYKLHDMDISPRLRRVCRNLNTI